MSGDAVGGTGGAVGVETAEVMSGAVRVFLVGTASVLAGGSATSLASGAGAVVAIETVSDVGGGVGTAHPAVQVQAAMTNAISGRATGYRFNPLLSRRG